MSSEVTVVIPTHNRAKLLTQALESVLRSSLIRDPHQIVVVDDASTDATGDVAADAGVRYARTVGNGPSRTRNIGLGLADTEFVAFLDDDDCWLPNNLEAQLVALRQCPDAAYGYGRTQMTRMDLVPFGEAYPYLPLRSGSVAEYILRRPPQLGAVLFRRSHLQAFGAFDESLRYAEDVDLLVGLAVQHPVVGVDVIGCLFRQRQPSPADAQARWFEYRDVRRLHRKWTTSRSPLSRRGRARALRAYCGRATHQFCWDALAAARAGQPSLSLRFVRYALQISAPHAVLRSSAFWQSIWVLLSQRSER